MDAVISLNRLKIGRYLESLIQRLENPEPLYREIGAAMSANTKLRISTGTDVDGTPFVPSYRALEQNGETLKDTGRMQSAITYLATKKGVTWGVPTGFPHAAILNFGGTITAKTSRGLRFKVGSRWVTKNSVTIPKRQFVGFSLADKQEVLDIVYGFLGGMQ
jgi:phage gpG-like protein